MKKSYSSVAPSQGWYKSVRSDERRELRRKNPLAYVLADVIADRARWREGFNAEGLGQGEALLGDFENYGMSRQQYRTARNHLEKHGFATFKTTNRGTVGKLIDTRLFDCLPKEATTGATREQPSANHQPTTNEEGKERYKGKGKPPSILDLKDIRDAKEQQARDIKNNHCSEGALDEHWTTKDHKQQHAALRREVKELTGRIADMGI